MSVATRPFCFPGLREGEICGFFPAIRFGPAFAFPALGFGADCLTERDIRSISTSEGSSRETAVFAAGFFSLSALKKGASSLGFALKESIDLVSW